MRKVTWLEGQLAVAECSSESQLTAPPSYQESQREVERRADQSDPSRTRGARSGGDVRQADMEEVARRLLANSRVIEMEELEEEEEEVEPPPLAPRGEERQAPQVERRSPTSGQAERQSMNISSQAVPLLIWRTGEAEHHCEEEREAQQVERQTPATRQVDIPSQAVPLSGQAEGQSVNISSQVLPLVKKPEKKVHHPSLNKTIKAIGQER